MGSGVYHVRNELLCLSGLVLLVIRTTGDKLEGTCLNFTLTDLTLSSAYIGGVRSEPGDFYSFSG
jgi:hypothetical protein